MTGTSFERLDVYRRVYELALVVHKETLSFPKIEQYVLADQMRRASKSVCANIAESYSRQRMSGADYKRFLVMATGSADEMRVWCSFARDLEYISADTAEQWRQSYAEIARMLNGLMKAWDKQPK